MPELPDLALYAESIALRVGGHVLEKVRLGSPFPSLVRSTQPITELEGHTLQRIDRLGKRLVFVFGDELRMVVHLMIAGRFRYEARGA